MYSSSNYSDGSLGASLWLMPPSNSPLFETLRSTIEGLKPLFDDGVRFDPHVTIVSKIRISNRAQVDSILDQALAACKAVPNLRVVMEELKFGSQFFKKVYLKVSRTTELISLARISKEEFVTSPSIIGSQKHYEALSTEEHRHLAGRIASEANQWVKTEYDPHLSLVYSNEYPVDEAMQKTIHDRLHDVFGTNFEHKQVGWSGGRLALVNTQGPVESWQVLGYRDIH